MLKVENLNVYYGMIHAIKDISLEVQKGEIVSLVGANGAGKTTTLQKVSRILRIFSINSSVSDGFIPAAGSSNSNSFGSVANARTISSRRCAP